LHGDRWLLSSDPFQRNELRDAQEFVAVSLKIGLREWAFIIVATCVAVSLFYSTQRGALKRRLS